MYEKYSNQSVVKKVFTAAILVVFGFFIWFFTPNKEDEEQNLPSVIPTKHAHQAPTVAPPQPLEKPLSAQKNTSSLPPLPDFTYAAKVATSAVVHIKGVQKPEVFKRNAITPLEQFLREFFGERLLTPKDYEQPVQESFGSGVIYTSDGYIITNNHVVEGTDEIEVTLNDNRSYKAKLVGSDPVTDLALLKIAASGLPALVIGSSDKLEVGEWVLAVGNPFNLCSTVTSGIVSAKSRHLAGPENGQCGKLGIQSFIQTDAVINPGNSGGALVNLYGELVGINTAIYVSRSPSFIGYGFAIPSSLVKKVADDFIQYGAVQRVLLGVAICDLNAALAKKLGLKITSGVYIDSVQEDSPCVKLLQKEDVITQINGRPITKSAELQEIIGCAKPGDKVNITLYRKGKEKVINVLLKKEPDSIQMVQKNGTLKVEGAVFQNLDEKTKAKLKLSIGVLVQQVEKGKFQTAGLKKGYILLAFNKQPVKNITELSEIIRKNKETALILQVMESNKGSVSHLLLELGKADVPHTAK